MTRVSRDADPCPPAELATREALRAAEERFRLLVEQSPAILYIDAIDEHSTSLYVSPGVEALTGYSAEEWLAEPDIWLELVHPDDRAAVEAEHLRTNQTGSPFSMEYRLIAKDGRVVWVRDEATVLPGANGEPDRWQGILVDVSEARRNEAILRQSERQLRETEARYRTLVEELPAIIYINAWDDPHPMTYVSPHVEDLLGYPASQWLEQTGFVYTITHPDDRQALRGENERTEALGARFSLEYRLIASDGRIVWVRDECVPVYDGDGQPLFYQGIMVDVTDQKLAEEALRDSEERFRSAFDDAAIAMGIADLDGRLLRVNQPHCDLLGYREDELVGKDIRALIHPDDLALSDQRRLELLSGAIRSYKTERRYLHKDGHVVWGLVNLSLMRDPEGQPRFILAQVQDITDRKLIEESLRESEERFRGAFDYATVGMSLSTPAGQYIRVNRAFCEMLGYSEAELLARTYDAITDPDDQAEGAAYRKRLLAGEIDHFQIEKRYRHRDGHPVWTLLSVALVRDGRGEPRYVIGQAQDITARKQLEARLLHQAFHDSLTGLPNRALFTDRIEHALARARRHAATVAVLFLDLDGFKAVNDSHGHAGGDQLLIEIGQRLRGWVRAGDTVARLGGDEFTVLLDELRTPAEAIQIAERVIDGLRSPVLIDGQSAWVRASVGIAYNTPGEITPAALLRNADVALYRAKHAGGDQYRVYDTQDAYERIGTVELRATYP